MKRTLLVSQPGIVQDATLATVSMLPDIRVVYLAHGALLATRMLQEESYDLLLTDANVPQDEVLALIQWTRAHCPAVQVIAMAATSQQRDEALQWGAHAAIHRASLASQLEATLHGLPLLVNHDVDQLASK